MQSDPTKLRVVKQIKRHDILFCVAGTPRSSRFFVGSSDSNVYSIDLAVEPLAIQRMEGHRGYVTDVVLADQQLISAAYDGRLIWWDVESGRPIRTLDAHPKWIRAVRFSPRGRILASVGDDMVCRLWDLDNGALLSELRGHEPATPHHFPSMLFCCTFSPDGQLLATADKVGKIIVWQVTSGRPLAVMEAPKMYTWDPEKRLHSIGGIRSLAFSPDARLLAAGGIGQIDNIDHLKAPARVEVFDWRQAERTHELSGGEYEGLVEYLKFHPKGTWLLAAGGDHNGFLTFFDVNSHKIIKQDKTNGHIHDLVFNESYDTIWTVGHQQIVIWDLTG